MSTDDTSGQAQNPDPSVSEGEPVSKGEAPQAMGFFNEPTEADVKMDPDNPAFDRVQDGKQVDEEYEREYNRRYVKEHGDHHGHKPLGGPDADRQP